MATVSDWLDDFDFESDLISPLMDNGWYQYLFPFLLIYAVLITILNNVPMFEKNKAVKVIISLVISLFAIAFPIEDGGNTIGDLMIALFPGVTAFSIGILALYIVAAMLGVDLMKFLGDGEKDKWLRYVLGAAGLAVVVYYYAIGFGWEGWDGSDAEEFFEDPLLYILIVAAFTFYIISRDDDEGSSKDKKKSPVEVKVGEAK